MNDFHTDNPAGLLRDAFEALYRTGAEGLPPSNPALCVDVVGWRNWSGEWLGIVVTPGSMLLMILPGGGGRFRPLAGEERQRWALPSGEYEFSGGIDETLGAYQSCPLYTSMEGFDTQAVALEVARTVMDNLMLPRAAPPSSAPASAADEPPRPLSRRAFLFGRGRP